MISNESILSNASSVILDTLPCFLVNNLSSNSAEQCKFIIDNDCLEDEATIDYVYLVYCELGYELRYAAILIIALLVIVLFLNLSSVADEFLCPSLLSVAKNLRMSDSLAGVTLLAFGNGCPDIFASLAAASSGRPELIIGELLGAGIFCTSIVAGLIFIHSDFKLASRPLLRDAVFYLLAVYLIWYYCWEEAITFYGSLTFIVTYVIYLIVALGGQAIHARMQGNYAISETQAENNIQERGKNSENWYKWREESLRRRKISRCEQLLDTTALRPRDKPFVSYGDGVTSVHFGSDPHSMTAKRLTSESSQSAKEIQIYSSIKFSGPSLINIGSGGGGHVNKAFDVTNEKCKHEIFELKPIFNGGGQQQKGPSQPTIKLVESPAKQLQELTTAISSKLTLSEWDDFLAHISPIDPENWRRVGFFGKIIQIIRAPLLFVAIVTIPVIDRDRRLSNWCRLLNTLHCVTVPLFMVIAIKIDENWTIFGITLRVLVIVPGVIIAFIVFRTTNPHEAPKYHAAFAYFGFMMSILWVYLLANEIISLLKTVGIIFSMTDTAIGLGVLAWGNSLGDIVANISLADAGYPRMALGASIGAPLLNLLLGFGLAFTISLKPGQISPIQYSPTITLLCSTLVIILISLMLSTLVPPEKSRRPFGYLLIFAYGVYFALAVCFESGLIKF